MPLYVNTEQTGDVPEIRRVIPGHREATICEASPSWERISDGQLAELRDGRPLPEVLAAPGGD